MRQARRGASVDSCGANNEAGGGVALGALMRADRLHGLVEDRIAPGCALGDVVGREPRGRAAPLRETMADRAWRNGVTSDGVAGRRARSRQTAAAHARPDAAQAPPKRAVMASSQSPSRGGTGRQRLADLVVPPRVQIFGRSARWQPHGQQQVRQEMVLPTTRGAERLASKRVQQAMTVQRKIPQVPKVSRSTLQERVYLMLKRSIMTGILVPGQPVSIKSLADALGTSPIPVREALRFLAAERAVVVMANGSVSVPTMTRARFEDLRRARILVEGFTTELAAKFISEKDIEKLEKLHLHIEELRQKGDVRNFWDQSQKLRLIIYSSARSETLEPIIESLWLQARPYINLLSMSHPLVETGVSYDRACIDALKQGEGVQARHWTERDIMEVGEHILQVLPE